LPLLATVLKSRLLAASDLSTRAANQTANFKITSKESGGASTALRIEKDIHRCLEMVAISRVFDIEGVWEVLGEIRRSGASELVDVLRASSEGDFEKEGFTAGKASIDHSSKKAQEILDSDEELSSMDEDVAGAPELADGEATAVDDAGTEIIIVDNMTHIINELFARKEKSDGKLF
jgi:hypothetical protein